MAVEKVHNSVEMWADQTVGKMAEGLVQWQVEKMAALKDCEKVEMQAGQKVEMQAASRVELLVV